MKNKEKHGARAFLYGTFSTAHLDILIVIDQEDLCINAHSFTKLNFNYKFCLCFKFSAILTAIQVDTLNLVELGFKREDHGKTRWSMNRVTKENSK